MDTQIKPLINIDSFIKDLSKTYQRFIKEMILNDCMYVCYIFDY